MRRGTRWSQSGGGPLAHAAGASVLPNRGRPPHPCGEGLGGPKAEEAPSPMRRGPRWSQMREASSIMRRVPRWSQSGGGPLAHTPEA